jgi:hypothetical protein
VTRTPSPNRAVTLMKRGPGWSKWAPGFGREPAEPTRWWTKALPIPERDSHPEGAPDIERTPEGDHADQSTADSAVDPGTLSDPTSLVPERLGGADEGGAAGGEDGGQQGEDQHEARS